MAEAEGSLVARQGAPSFSTTLFGLLPALKTVGSLPETLLAAERPGAVMSLHHWNEEHEGFDTAGPDLRPVVVLAEDNEDARRVYCLILRHFGYRVETAATGVEAVDLVRALHPSLVLMDIGLPLLDGFQASRLLKSDSATSSIPLIAFSARVDSTADLVSGGPTFDGYILKPVSPQELVRRVEAYLALLGAPRKHSDRSTAYWSDGSRGESRERSLSA